MSSGFATKLTSMDIARNGWMDPVLESYAMQPLELLTISLLNKTPYFPFLLF